jgi:transcriptional regulator with XRE-family HTH domain
MARPQTRNASKSARESAFFDPPPWEELRRRREQLGLTQDAFGVHVSLTQGEVSRIENGRQCPDIHQAARIEKVCGLPVEIWSWVDESVYRERAYGRDE